MTIQQAIQKAVEGGYDNDFGFGTPREYEYKNGEIERAIYGYVLDPSFWRALGKSMGWSEWTCKTCEYSYEKFKEGNSCRDCRSSERPVKGEENGSWEETWRHYWHLLIDHLAEGGSIETFFEKLK